MSNLKIQLRKFDARSFVLIAMAFTLFGFHSTWSPPSAYGQSRLQRTKSNRDKNAESKKQNAGQEQSKKNQNQDQDSKGQTGQYQLKTGTYYQVLDVARFPKFMVSGLPVNQEMKYRIISSFKISNSQETGKLDVQQQVLDAQLVSADALTKTAIAGGLKDLIGKKFTFVLDGKHEVHDFKGDKDNAKTSPFEGLGGKGFMVTSVMDEDAWKEMAQLAFFKPVEKKQRWSKQMSHDWGDLGRWVGQTGFTLKRKRRDILNVQYGHDMKHVVGKKKDGASPLTIGRSEFKVNKAGGNIQFNTKLNRVSQIDEIFEVSGRIETTLLGTKSVIEMQEQQTFQMRIIDQNPLQQRRRRR